MSPEQLAAARQAQELVRTAVIGRHPYLARMGFPEQMTRLRARDGDIVVPIRDADDYRRQVINVQIITERGEKRLVPGGRTLGGIHRLGVTHASKTVLCEDWATGLALEAALRHFRGTYAVIVCFSALNLESVAGRFPGAIVCADNDTSREGENSARRTGLRWIMPRRVGDTWNHVHRRWGSRAVEHALRGAFEDLAAA